ncbi:unnamed protein product [Rotaria magnacalcarata]|uniref:Uncharacterized protein n=2 Tax=Rotaria magnacalcarata TaxID=392030 RepID=A0A816CFP8_9BILA|nr:unnamed protein product [Rotaria magnacalcarata]CAF4276582.1 unnamed protein product [Rotaria magnacalcarata]
MVMILLFVLDLKNNPMERTARIRKPTLRYDPSVYVLASFPKKNKHTIIPKHHVTIDAIDEHNGTLKSSGFIQSVRIIAEDNFLNIFLITTLDFSLASGYKHNRNSGKHVISDDDNEIEEEETIHATQGRSNTDCPKNTDDSPAAPLVIDEHSSNGHNTQESRTNVLSNVNGNLSDISERISERDDDDDDDDDLVLPQVKPMKKKRKTASRPKQSTSNEALVTEVSNIHKEFLSFRYNIEKRIKSLEKTFRILKNRKILKEIVLGVDVSKFRFGFDEHTKFARQIFRQARYTSDPNLVLSNKNMVIEIQNAMKKRDKRLQSDDAYFKDTWQIVKELLRQLKHDHIRNNEYKTFRATQNNNRSSSPSKAIDINA